eukprot:SAG31_NODE_35909_length_318_cov_0.945205_1_plen_79_part_10
MQKATTPQYLLCYAGDRDASQGLRLSSCGEVLADDTLDGCPAVCEMRGTTQLVATAVDPATGRAHTGGPVCLDLADWDV